MKYSYALAPELVPVLEAYKSQPAPPEGTELKEIFRAMTQEMALLWSKTCRIYPAFIAVGTMNVHIFDALVPDSAAAKDFVAARNSALMRAFAN